MVDYDAVHIGLTLDESTTITRLDLVRYAGASGDFNPIHWSDRAAGAVALPGVIAHGMLTMARALRVLTDWTGDPASVIDSEVRFTRPVPVPDDDSGATVSVTATVLAKLPDLCVRVGLTARTGAHDVLSHAVAVVRLS